MDITPKTLRVVPDDWLHPLPLKTCFGSDPSRPLEVDVGSGKGRFLLARARAHPEVDFLGVDRMLRRIRKVDRKAIRAGLLNIRLLRVEAYYATAHLMPADAISTYYIFFPDPWPKKRHHQHRLFNPPFIDALHRTMKAGGLVHFATDHLPYFEGVKEIMDRDARFEGVDAFVPSEEERTDFELYYLGRTPIGRASWRRR